MSRKTPRAWRMVRPPVVHVVWLDAHELGATEDVAPSEVASRVHRGWPTHTVGFLLQSDATGVSIATDVQEPDTETDGAPNYRGAHFIPRGMIVHEKILSPARKSSRARDVPKKDGTP